jgi:hypothetical protein
MDPDANIANQRLLIARLRVEPGDQDARNELAELNQALLGWLANGGFSPVVPDWTQVTAEAFRLLASQTGGPAHD